MASGDVTLQHGASGAVSGLTLASLATSATWVAGAESDAIDAATAGVEDYHISGQVMVGTTPTVNTEIRVYVVAKLDDTNWPDVFDGTGSAETVTSAGVRDGFAKLAATMFVDTTTSNRGYPFGPFSVAQLFGGVLPKQFVLFVTHNTVAALNSTGGNHYANYVSKKRNVSP